MGWPGTILCPAQTEITIKIRIKITIGSEDAGRGRLAYINCWRVRLRAGRGGHGNGGKHPTQTRITIKIKITITIGWEDTGRGRHAYRRLAFISAN